MGRFPDTQWSLIRRSGDAPALRREAFSGVARVNPPPVRAYFPAHLAAADAEEAAQSFLAASYEHGWWARADAAVGSFRGFLLVLLRRHLGHLRDLRGPDATHLDEVATWLPDPGAAAERLFDARFALLLAARAIHRLRGEYHGRGREALFEDLLRLLGDPPKHGELQAVAGSLGRPPNTLSVELGRLRKRLRAAIGDELRELCADQADFDVEWAALQAVLDGG
jgi:hypothetical protein